MLSNVRTLAKSYPVRFNRQRREVCYIDDTTHRVLIVPWESVVAWVARSQGVTSYGAMRDYTFGMGLEDEAHDTVQFILSAQPSDAHALGMWTAIRNYMEEGSWSIRPTHARCVLHHQARTSSNPMKGCTRLKSSGLTPGSWATSMTAWMTPTESVMGIPKRTPWPLRWWYVRRVLTFWKMPYLIAEWAHRKGRPTLPQSVQAWSRPLPPNNGPNPARRCKKPTHW
jgi:hypothetical protein